MKKKTKKVWKIIGIVFAALLCVAYLVFYIIYPEQTLYWTDLIIDYVCNKPLPVIGVSILFVAIFVYKLVKYLVNHKGIKMQELLAKIGTLNAEIDNLKEENDQLKELVYEKYEQGKENLKKVCDAIPNKKVKAVGEEIYGEETNSKTETESI